MKILITSIVMLLLSLSGTAQTVVTDPTVTGQVITNSGVTMGYESLIKSQYNRGATDKEKASASILAVQAAMTLQQVALNNVSAFKVDSRNIQEIIRLAGVISAELPLVAKEIFKNPKAGIAGTKMLKMLSEEVSQSATYIYSIVTNGSVNIGFGAKKHSDGHNLIDPKQRLDMANHIIINLRRVYNILLQVKIQFMYNTSWGKVFQERLPLDVYFVIDSKRIVEDIINNFKKP